MIHNRYMEMSIMPGQDRDVGFHAAFVICPMSGQVSLCSSEAGGVCSGQRVQRSLILPGLESWNAAGLPVIPHSSPRAKGSLTSSVLLKKTINVERR